MKSNQSTNPQSMSFFNRYLLVYAMTVVALTLVFIFVNTHYFDGTTRQSGWLLSAYLALIIMSVIFLGRKDKSNNLSGFSYHFTTYVILVGFAAKGAWTEDYEPLRDELEHMVLALMVVWGIVLLLHLGIHFLRQRMKR